MDQYRGRMKTGSEITLLLSVLLNALNFASAETWTGKQTSPNFFFNNCDVCTRWSCDCHGTNLYWKNTLSGACRVNRSSALFTLRALERGTRLSMHFTVDSTARETAIDGWIHLSDIWNSEASSTKQRTDQSRGVKALSVNVSVR